MELSKFGANCNLQVVEKHLSAALTAHPRGKCKMKSPQKARPAQRDQLRRRDAQRNGPI